MLLIYLQLKLFPLLLCIKIFWHTNVSKIHISSYPFKKYVTLFVKLTDNNNKWKWYFSSQVINRGVYRKLLGTRSLVPVLTRQTLVSSLWNRRKVAVHRRWTSHCEHTSVHPGQHTNTKIMIQYSSEYHIHELDILSEVFKS